MKPFRCAAALILSTLCCCATTETFAAALRPTFPDNTVGAVLNDRFFYFLDSCSMKIVTKSHLFSPDDVAKGSKDAVFLPQEFIEGTGVNDYLGLKAITVRQSALRMLNRLYTDDEIQHLDEIDPIGNPPEASRFFAPADETRGFIPTPRVGQYFAIYKSNCGHYFDAQSALDVGLGKNQAEAAIKADAQRSSTLDIAIGTFESPYVDATKNGDLKVLLQLWHSYAAINSSKFKLLSVFEGVAISDESTGSHGFASTNTLNAATQTPFVNFNMRMNGGLSMDTSNDFSNPSVLLIPPSNNHLIIKDGQAVSAFVSLFADAPSADAIKTVWESSGIAPIDEDADAYEGQEYNHSILVPAMLSDMCKANKWRPTHTANFFQTSTFTVNKTDNVDGTVACRFDFKGNVATPVFDGARDLDKQSVLLKYVYDQTVESKELAVSDLLVLNIHKEPIIDEVEFVNPVQQGTNQFVWSKELSIETSIRTINVGLLSGNSLKMHNATLRCANFQIPVKAAQAPIVSGTSITLKIMVNQSDIPTSLAKSSTCELQGASIALPMTAGGTVTRTIDATVALPQ